MPFPPPIIKYISLYATYLHPIYSGRRLPVGPSPWSHPHQPCLPPTPGRLPRWEAEPSVVHLGLQVLPTRGKSTAFIRPSTRKKIHTTPITHARREGPGPPSSPDTRDSRGGKQKRRGMRPEGRPRGPPRPLSCCPPRLVAHLARGVGSQGTRATTNLEAPCSPHLGLKPKGRGGLGFCFLKRKSENKHNYNQNHKNNYNKRCHQPPSIKLQPLEMTKNITFQGPEAALCTEGGWWGPHKRTHKKRLRQESTSTFCMFFYLLQVGSELSLARTLDFFSDPTARSPRIG